MGPTDDMVHKYCQFDIVLQSCSQKAAWNIEETQS